MKHVRAFCVFALYRWANGQILSLLFLMYDFDISILIC